MTCALQDVKTENDEKRACDSPLFDPLQLDTRGVKLERSGTRLVADRLGATHLRAKEEEEEEEEESAAEETRRSEVCHTRPRGLSRREGGGKRGEMK